MSSSTPPSNDPFAIPADTLGMDSATMRRLGHKVVDMVVDRLERRNTEAVITTGKADDLTARLGGPLPDAPSDPDAALDLLAEVALTNMQHGDHPRYFARVPGPAAFAATLGDWLGTGFNTICASWGGGSGPAVVETTVCAWVAEMLGLPARTEGVLLSGGSMANFTGFCVARFEIGAGVAYLTDQTHASLPRNLLQMGLVPEQIRILPSDDALRMSADTLAHAIAEDKAAGRRPMMVVATAGSTNTGATDPLEAIADICAAHDIWMHVDGAYGAPAAITDRGRATLAGLERADSVVLDPHKWFFQPYDLGLCLVTRPGALERCFSMNPEYLRDVQATSGEVNYGNRSLELSRRSRALKLWMSLRTHGAQAFRDAVLRGIELAEFTEDHLRHNPSRWEIITPAQLGIVCFAHRGSDAADHAARAARVSASGFATLSSTMLKDRSALRLCTINPLTTEDDITRTLEMLAAPN
ncbi:L-2,4-diaminobutyrate decarboxylase [Roseobacter sp. AzwK-3b]|uniref:pyridoxal phosphate-dependent decarboxylase family protein n=1 Tax=Roseobacter sp. AzwK-3b TaxID=351016 RepID=UPI000156AEF1|nr:aminotransferase class I/II-fold pyridoxal phosphate-dependent enzyme [Roseobacter sp. AzwK-3b]EDM69494.1 L-2,4-diaminobutyrate decarboxylase [Roseobacter sp. AzwK-3b]